MAVNQEKPPEPVSKGVTLYTAPNGKEKSWKDWLIPAAMAVIVSFLVVQMYFVPQLVSKTDFNSNLSNVSKDISSLKTASTNSDSQIANVNRALQTVNGDVASIKVGLGNYAAKDSVVSFQTNLNTLQTDLNGVKTSQSTQNTDITSLKKQVTDLQTSYDKLNKQITDLQTKVITPTPPTGTGGVTYSSTVNSTLNGVTAYLISYGGFNPFSGSGTTTLNLPATSATSNATTTQFQISIVNPLGRQITNIQLAVAFYFMDSSGNPTPLPAGTSVSVTTWTGNPMFSVQNAPDGSTNPIVFVTGNPNAVFGNYWNFYQDSGSSTYQCTLKTDSTVRPAYTVYPQIKLVSFN